MLRFRSSLRRAGATLVLALAAGTGHAQVSLTALGVPYTQNFDTLPASGSATWSNNSTIPGWYHARTGTGATVVANDGTSNAGNLYSFGTGTATDRALGSLGSGNAAIGNLFWGVRLQNNTGATITSLDVSYVGEQWRNSAAAGQTIAFSYLVGSPTVSGSLPEFQAAGTAVAALDFTSPITGGTAVALNGNLVANRVAQTFSITGLNIPNGSEVMLRWSDPDHTGADHGLAIDDFSVTPQGGGAPPSPTLSISDVSQSEGNPPGTTTFTFEVTLSAPAGPGGVTFDIATADGTAQDGVPGSEDNDYVAQSLTGQTIPAGSAGLYNFSVTVNRDTTVEPNETFFVNVTNITGANAGDTQGVGTIINDDITLTPIHDIQGPGASSPLVGAVVTTRGIVTGVRSNGFYIQEPDATVDADPATSEGIYVFTNSAPPGAAALGNEVQVSGTVAEFVPAQDPLQPPLTELVSPTVTLLGVGNPLPAPVPLSPTFPDPAGPHDQLERLEGMRVSIASLTVAAPTQGNINEANATATSSGVFHGTITGVSRPFREPGIQAPDPAPAGASIPPIPRWDANPELLRVDSDGLVGGPLLDVSTGAIVTGLVGPLDYTFRRYTVLPDPGAPVGVAGGMAPVPATVPTEGEITIATYNVQRFFDAVDDPDIGEPVLTAGAFDARLTRASLAIRNYLHAPDIIGLVEVENLSTLQALATRINADAIAASQPDPGYVAYLVEGNDVGGIDVGFLVKTFDGGIGVPRVQVVEVVQENAGELFVNPDSTTQLLNDRPPLRLSAIVNPLVGPGFPVTVIVNHLRSLNDQSNEGPGSNGWPTLGARVRAKRQAQANSLANLVQARQVADPAERIVVIGDFNAFEFNDGLVHMLGTIAGAPVPDNETAVPGDGIDLVSPDLVNLADTRPPSERYSYVFDGNAQTIDHVLVNQSLVNATTARRIEHARINADFPQTARNVPGVLRLADHDPVIAYLAVPGATDLAVTMTDSPDPVVAGAQLTYTIELSNAAAAAGNVVLEDTLPPGTSFVSLAAPGGWSCATPAVGAGGTVSCSIASFAAAGAASFTLVVGVDVSLADGTILSNSATVTSSTVDADPSNDTGSATTTVTGASADLSVTIADSPDPVAPGTAITYAIQVANAGPGVANSVALSTAVPANTVFGSLTAPAGWNCTTPAGGATGAIDCTIATLALGNAAFTLAVAVDSGAANATITAGVDVSSANEGAPGDETATTTTVVGSGLADLSVTIADSPDPVAAGGNITYAIGVANAGPNPAFDAALDATLAAGTSFVSFSADAGWSCTTPAVGAGGSIACTRASMPVGASAFSLVVAVDGATAGGTVVTQSVAVDSSTPDSDSVDRSASTNTLVVTDGAALVARKSASGQLRAGGAVTYQIVIENQGPGAQPDLAGDEFVDVLPAGLTLVSASATSGTAVANIGTGTVTWNGALAAGASVTITIQASIDAGLAPGATIANQAEVSFDADGDGTSESSGLSDDPGTAASGDATVITLLGPVATGPAVVPTASATAQALLAAMLMLFAATALRRRA